MPDFGDQFDCAANGLNCLQKAGNVGTGTRSRIRKLGLSPGKTRGLYRFDTWYSPYGSKRKGVFINNRPSDFHKDFSAGIRLK